MSQYKTQREKNEKQNDRTKVYQYEGLGFNILYENSYKEASGVLKTGFEEESVYAVKSDFAGEAYQAGFCEEDLNALKGADLETTYRYRYIEESQNCQKQENKSYIYKDGTLVALADGISKAYYSSDIHGSTRQVSDTSGFSESYNYDSFGKPIYKSSYVEYEEGYDLDTLLGESIDWQQIDTENTSKNDYRFSSWYQANATNVSPYASQYHDYLSVAGYSGKSYNSNTGLNNYGFRDYSSNIGRFITSDPIRDGTNWYTLAVNNPVCFVDLWGLCTQDTKIPNGMVDPDQFCPQIDEIINYTNTSLLKLSNNDEVIISQTNSYLVLVEKTEKRNENNATIGVLSVYYNAAGVFDLNSPLTKPEFTAPIVTGGKNDPECPNGVWEDIKRESTSISSNNLLSSGECGEFYYRLTNTDGIAIHQANPTASISRAYTEGCVGITGDEYNTPKENYKKFLSVLGEENVTIYVK